MAFLSSRSFVRSSLATVAVTLVITSAGCGGGSDEFAVAPEAPASKVGANATSTHSVAVQGCVVDRHYIPTTGAPIRALVADGRLPGRALSDSQCRFTLRLPSNSTVTLQIDRLQSEQGDLGETLTMEADAASPTWETCLLDERA